MGIGKLMGFEDYLGLNNDDTFALRVKDDGMADAGILANDLVLVRKQSVAQEDEIVVAMLNEKKAILRYLRRAGKRYFLVTSTPKYEPIRVDENVSLIGKVIHVISGKAV